MRTRSRLRKLLNLLIISCHNLNRIHNHSVVNSEDLTCAGQLIGCRTEKPQALFIFRWTGKAIVTNFQILSPTRSLNTHNAKPSHRDLHDNALSITVTKIRKNSFVFCWQNLKQNAMCLCAVVDNIKYFVMLFNPSKAKTNNHLNLTPLTSFSRNICLKISVWRYLKILRRYRFGQTGAPTDLLKQRWYGQKRGNRRKRSWLLKGWILLNI